MVRKVAFLMSLMALVVSSFANVSLAEDPVEPELAASLHSVDEDGEQQEDCEVPAGGGIVGENGTNRTLILCVTVAGRTVSKPVPAGGSAGIRIPDDPSLIGLEACASLKTTSGQVVVEKKFLITA